MMSDPPAADPLQKEVGKCQVNNKDSKIKPKKMWKLRKRNKLSKLTLVRQAEENKIKLTWHEKIKNQVFDQIPPVGGVDLDDLEKVTPGFPIIISILYAAGYFFCLIFLTYTGTMYAMNQKFLSLTKDDSSFICNEVPISVTGSYEGDYSGNFITQSDFNYNKSIFAVEFTGSKITTQQYTETMTTFKTKLSALGKKGARRSLTWNIVVWSSFAFYDDSTNLRFYSTADATIIFDKIVALATISDRNGVCTGYTDSTKSYISGSFQDGRLEITVPMQIDNRLIDNFFPTYWNSTAPYIYYNIPTCPMQSSIDQWLTNPTLKFYSAYRQAKSVTLGFHIRSIILAVSLNMGITSIDGLVQTKNLNTENGDMIAYVDPYYSTMDPVYCIQKSSSLYSLDDSQINGPEVCFLLVGSFDPMSPGIHNYIYPAISQLYQDWNQTDLVFNPLYSQCKCPDDKDNQQCNAQQFGIGLVYDSVTNAQGLQIPIDLALRMQRFVLDDPVDGDQSMMDFISPIFSYTSNIYGSTQSSDLPLPFSFASHSPINYSWKNLLQNSYDAICPTCGTILFQTCKSRKNPL